MANETGESIPNTASAPAKSGPSKAQRRTASVVQAAFLLVFGAIGFYAMGYLFAADLIERPTGTLFAAMMAGAIIVGVIVGGIIGAKVKKAILK